MHKQNNGQTDPLKQLLSEAMSLSDNKLCQECHCRGPHTWASWNLGVFFCIRCAGIHRKLGVHISKVKSCTLDQWQSHQVDSLISKGNKQSWLYYEYNLPKGHVRPNDSSSLEVFIRNKYERKLYIPKDGSVSIPGEQLSEETPASVPEVRKSPPVTKKETHFKEKKVVKKAEKTKNSLTIPSAPSRPHSQPSSPLKPPAEMLQEDSLLLDVAPGLTASRSESDFAFLDDVEKMFTSKTQSDPNPSNSAPLSQTTAPPTVDFLEPLVQSSASQMNTKQIMSLYQVPTQTGGIIPAPNYQPRYPPPQPVYYQPNASAYRQQQQKMVNEVADIQKTLDSLKTSGRVLQPSAAANGTEVNDPWEQPVANGIQAQPGQTLSLDLWH